MAFLHTITSNQEILRLADNENLHIPGLLKNKMYQNSNRFSTSGGLQRWFKVRTAEQYDAHRHGWQ